MACFIIARLSQQHPRTRLQAEIGPQPGGLPPFGFHGRRFEACGIRIGRTVIQYVASALVQAHANNQTVSGHWTRHILFRSQPLFHQSTGLDPHGIQFLLKFGALSQHAVVGLLFFWLRNPHDRGPDWAIVIEGLFVEIVEERAQRVKIVLRGWVELVIVADGATHSKSHERGAERFRALSRYVYAQLFWNGATFIAADPQAHITARDQGIECLHRHQVAGDLLNGELIERLVHVEGADHVIAVWPDVAAVVEMEAVGIGIASVVEPIPCALLAKSRARQQSINHLFVCIGRRVAYKCPILVWRRQQPRDIQGDPPNERRFVRFRGRFKSHFLQLRVDEVVDRVLSPRVGTAIVGNTRADRRLESPMWTINSALFDPLSENCDLAGIHRLGFALRILRHQIMRIFRLDSFGQLTLLRMTGNDGVAMPLALLHRPFREVKPQAGFAHFRIGTVTAEATAGQDRLHILIEIQASNLLMAATSGYGYREGDKEEAATTPKERYSASF